MCGRYANSETIPVLRRIFAADGADVDWQPSYNITPTRRVPVLLGDRRSRRLGLMRWGWNPSSLGGKLLINCRGEEAHAKRMFERILPRQRCLVPATQFYEWQPPSPTLKGRSKIRPRPFAFALHTESPFLIGGLWTATEGAGSMILMTTPANGVVAPVHDRMPLIIAPEHVGEWLDPATDQTRIRSLIAPDAEIHWRSWPVGLGISDVRRDDAGLLEPLRDETESPTQGQP
jgi:putative SOS response-associated peptidase YedK